MYSIGNKSCFCLGALTLPDEASRVLVSNWNQTYFLNGNLERLLFIFGKIQLIIRTTIYRGLSLSTSHMAPVKLKIKNINHHKQRKGGRESKQIFPHSYQILWMKKQKQKPIVTKTFLFFTAFYYFKRALHTLFHLIFLAGRFGILFFLP